MSKKLLMPFLTTVILLITSLACGQGETSRVLEATTQPPAPAATPEPTVTPIPPTNTPEPTVTPIPPTNTPEPTVTPFPPTNTPEPSVTPIPPTNTPEPTGTPDLPPTQPATPEPIPVGESVQITVAPDCSQFDSPGDDSESKEEEYVCLSNQGVQAADLTGWTMKDEADWTYVFPAFNLDPAAIVRVRTGCGTDTEQDLYWCKEGATAVWNNGGDTVFLYDIDGNLVTEYSY